MNTPADTAQTELSFEGSEYLTKSEFGFALKALQSDHSKLDNRIDGVVTGLDRVENNLKEWRKEVKEDIKEAREDIKEARKESREDIKELRKEIKTFSSYVFTSACVVGSLILGGFSILFYLGEFFSKG